MKIAKLLTTLAWLSFALMWIPFIITIMGWENFDSPAEGAGSIIDTLGGWMNIGFGMMGLTFVVFIAAWIVGVLINRRIAHQGEDSVAKIIKASTTGEKTGENPTIKFTLDVRPKHHPSFVATAKQTISLANLGTFREGTLVGVKYIPGSETVVIAGYAENVEEAEQIFESRQGANTNTYEAMPQKKSTARYLLGSAAIVLIPLGIIGFVGYILLISARHTAEYSCAVSHLKKDPKVSELLGEPIELGFITTGNVKGSDNHRSAYFSTSISGSKSTGELYVESFREKDAESSMKIIFTELGKDTVFYDGDYPCK